MSEEQESSVLFSLNELMSIEEDRIRTEEEEKQRAADEAERIRLDGERQAREQELARMAAEEQQRREEEQRSREDAARLAAIQQGELETARADAENRARLEAMAAQQDHERRLVQLKEDKGKKNLRTAIIAGSIVVVLGASTAGWLVYRNYQETQLRQAADEAEKQRLKEESARLEREKKETEEKIAKLLDDLKNTKSDADRAKIQAEIDAERAKSLAGRGGGRGVLPGKTPSTPKPKCRPGDPLCSDI